MASIAQRLRTPGARRSGFHEYEIVYLVSEGLLLRSICIGHSRQTQGKLQDPVIRLVLRGSAEFLHKLISRRKSNVVLQGGAKQLPCGFRVGAIPGEVKIYVEIEREEGCSTSASSSNPKVNTAGSICRGSEEILRLEVANVDDDLSLARRSTTLRSNPIESILGIKRKRFVQV